MPSGLWKGEKVLEGRSGADPRASWKAWLRRLDIPTIFEAFLACWCLPVMHVVPLCERLPSPIGLANSYSSLKIQLRSAFLVRQRGKRGRHFYPRPLLCCHSTRAVVIGENLSRY